MHEFKPDDIVKSCDAIEAGCRLHPEGMGCCYQLPRMSPIMISAEEINSGKVTHDLVVKRRREIFEALNGLSEKDIGFCKKCTWVKEKKYKDVCFDYIGVANDMLSSFNVAPSYKCNLKCQYCYLKTTQDNPYLPAQYSIIDLLKVFKEKDKIRFAKWIEYNGGEPTIDKDFEKNIKYLQENKFGPVCIFSNSTNFSQLVYDYLKENKMYYETSVDAGTASSYAKIHGADCFDRVLYNIMRYCKSGTNQLIVKYILQKENMTQDDLLGFVFAMATIRPPHVYIAVETDFINIDENATVSDEEINFGARLWYSLEKFAGITPHLQSDDIPTLPQYAQFSKGVREEYARLIKENPITDGFNINKNCCKPKKKLSLRKRLFSISKENNHRIIRVAGLKVALKSR